MQKLSRFGRLAGRWQVSLLGLPAACIVAVLMIGFNEAAYHRASTRLERLGEIAQARLLLLNALQRTTEAESGKRGYLLTGSDEYLTPYRQAHADVITHLNKVNEVYRRFNDVDAENQVTRLISLIHAKLAEMDEVLRLFDDGKKEEAMRLVRTGNGHELMLQMRAEAQGLVHRQNERITTGLEEVFGILSFNRIGLSLLTVLALLALVMVARQGWLLEQQRQARQVDMAAEQARLESDVLRRTQELTELAEHLQTVREDERARLARELHDELGALLTTAKLDVARIRPKLQKMAPELAPQLTHLTESLNSGIALKRRIIEDLRPSTLSTLGLVAALEILCREFEERSGLKVAATLEPVRLGLPGVELTVFRLVQEALTNVVKYANAHQVIVQLHERQGEAEVCVSDDGIGFDQGSTSYGRHGLKGMRFRVEAAHGRLTVDSAPGQGVTIRAYLPLQPAEAAATPAS